ncbi:hypothetical protein TPB0596_04640 [Tsukamurella pulmonis]|uniref:hypothetical protein n=1 Tax=Tsukamurella pulmonis TaxID=47312 RepID=UPI001EE0BDE2|nr:hypothetical protein [Tsukamurella pulmonis]BDD80701.1 hypothetical protein TPB0596_04640 [Tsukamurella pulmonis]
MQSPIRTATAAAVTLAAVALTAPAVATADPETRCTTDPGGGTYSCVTLTPTATPPTSTGSRSGGSAWADRLPELGVAFWIGLALIITGAVIYAVTKPAEPAGRAAHGPAAGAAHAEAHGEKAVAAFMIGAGIIAVGWGVFGIAGALLAAVIGAPVMLVGIKGDSHAEQATSGYRQADADWQHRVEMARLNAQMNRPDPREYDPLNLGIAPPPAPPVQLPPEPRMDDADAIRWAKHGGHVELIPGSAAAALVARDGSRTAAEQAWIEACKAARLGGAEQRTSRIPGVNAPSEVFVPGADLVRVEVLEDGDAALVVRPRSLAVGAKQLADVTPYLLRTARVRHAGVWVRAHATDEHVIVLSNRQLDTPEQTSPTRTAPAADDDNEDW